MKYLWFIFLMVSGTVSAQPETLPEKNVIFDQLPEKLGLSRSSINCILQDREGFLWIGTWSGLIRYDGYSTTVFHSDNAPDKLKSNKIIVIYEDRDGFIWIGTHQGGLFRYDRNTNLFLQFRHNPDDPHSLSNNSVWSIQEDKNGLMWVGTEVGLNVLDPASKSFKRFYNVPGNPASLSQNFVTDIFLSSTGDLWIATEYGFNQLIVSPAHDSVSYTFKNYLYPTSDLSGSHHHIYQMNEVPSAKGAPVLWLSTKKGIKKLENGKITNFLAEGKSPGFNLFHSLMVVNGKHPYIITGSEMGLNFFDPETNTFSRFLGDFDQRVNLSHNAVTALYFDRAGVFWVGTKKGLNKFDCYSKNFESYQTATFDPTRSIITGLSSTLDGGYWISTIGGGLYKFKDHTFQRYRINNRDEDDFKDFIQTVYADGRGDVWIGTAGAGVYHFNEKKLDGSTPLITHFDHYNAKSSPALNDDYIMSLAEDLSGNIWIGTWSGGLNKITPEGKVEQFNDPLLKQAPLVVMHADRSGAVWIGTRGNGLYRMKPAGQGVDLRHYHSDEKTENGLTNNFVNTIYEDHAGGLWIGTEGGLNSLDRRTEMFSRRVLEEGPSNEVIVSILEDDADKLWLGHWDGLTVIDPLNTGFTKNYDSHDRIQGGFFYNNVCFKDQQGRLLFGGSDGFNIIDPSDVVVNPVKTKVAIIDFQILNKRVPYGEEFEGRVILDKPLAEMNEIVLKYFENSVSFEFTALNFASPEKTRYAYTLEGFNTDWTYTNSTRRYANYTNLNNGDYVFKVKATNNDGVWNEEVSSVRLVIRPPWWKTSWAVIGYVIVSISVLYVFRRFILMRANLIHDIKLERVQRENMERLNRSKLQFFTNISHEFRTPLTLILGPVQSLLESAEVGKFTRNQILRISNNAQRLLRLVNQLLDFRKAESGNMKLEVAEGNLVRFVKEIKLSFETLAEQMNIDFVLHASSNVITVWFDRDQFEKIMFNLLSNAFKHTPEGGKISILLSEMKEAVTLTIEDNGKGIKQEHFESIFQTFFSYDDDRHQTGTGIGLTLTKSLVDMHHGTIDVASRENEFTRFTIRLLKGSAHFNESELQHESKDIENLDQYTALAADDPDSTYDHPEPNTLTGLHKLLIVEDNAEVRGYIKSIFLGQYLVLEAEEGMEGLELALEELPDVIISDVMMPVMDGITLCKQLKSNLKTSHVPIILLTARTSLIFKVEGLETGADDYVTKPFNPKVLRLKVRNLIRTRELMRKIFQDNEVLNIEPHHITLTSTDERFVREALKSVEDNIDNAKYSVDDLIKDVGMSRMQLYRKLKALTGQSANEFIRAIRLKRAAQLLEQNQLTVAEITYEVGFNDLQYFRECFKKAFGATPSEYAQRTAGSHVEGEQ